VVDSDCGQILGIVFAIARFRVLSLLWCDSVLLGRPSPTFWWIRVL